MPTSGRIIYLILLLNQCYKRFLSKHRLPIPSDKLCVRFALHVERTTPRGCNVSLLRAIRRHLNWNFNFKLKHKSVVTSGKNLALSLLLFSEVADFPHVKMYKNPIRPYLLTDPGHFPSTLLRAWNFARVPLTT